jgi:hypothetical protein
MWFNSSLSFPALPSVSVMGYASLFHWSIDDFMATCYMCLVLKKENRMRVTKFVTNSNVDGLPKNKNMKFSIL